MGWGSALGDAIRFGMQFREGKRQFGIESAARTRDQDLRDAAEKRLAAAEAFQRLNYGMEAPTKLEGMFPDIAPDEMRYVQELAARDPVAAQNDPVYWQRRAEAMGKYGPAAKEERDRVHASRLALAKANHPGFDYGGRARLAQYQAYLRALGEAAKTDVPANGMYPFIIDPDTGEARQITPEEIAAFRRSAAEGSAGQIINSPIPGVQGEPSPPIQIRPPPPIAAPNPRLVPPTLGQSGPGGPKIPRAQVKMRSPEGEEMFVDPNDPDFAEAIRRGWTVVRLGVAK